ncbi:RNA polymerase sigma-70 factor, ECF subfamily [Mucilaginibacter lappiensis]|uniref:RNA polymerase sigma-70 factor (ECF subfamily) n=1 Tax=Mucilaginibacter lappiensis TaxID=354630 RepID=A0ABR6PK05_9SPHI|nr:RNA polymerase sigma-70 factor [Mucilaginibacter lappiensis]MBB6109320.1 RNA polymerase sigma-70 factor (ECF subfamily) [Mucilaginibacter lappiensis]SIR00236.1 RNA polymerase sigma-70 factor, ECF subfamily [Mucilaginibacter lappiensis]
MKDRKVDTLNLWKLICNNNDEKAFELLFHLLNNSLTKFCILYVNQREIAEEIVSDVFVKCWLNRKTLTEILNPETYLFVAVKNQSLNHIKKYSSIHLVQIEETNSVEFVNTYNPQREIENKELIFRMDKAITALPQQCRIVFRLIKEDGMKYKEVAEILNISPRTVQTQLFRAIKKLSIVLSNYDKLNNPKVHTSNIFKALSVIIGIWQLFFINL